jgi:hypothetical protein
VHSKPLIVFPTVMPFFQAAQKFSETKFCDCRIRIVVHKVCRLLMVVRLDRLEHSSVEGLQDMCHVRRQAQHFNSTFSTVVQAH